jgi:hypothetical protein
MDTEDVLSNNLLLLQRSFELVEKHKSSTNLTKVASALSRVSRFLYYHFVSLSHSRITASISRQDGSFFSSATPAMVRRATRRTTSGARPFTSVPDPCRSFRRSRISFTRRFWQGQDTAPRCSNAVVFYAHDVR